MAEDEFARRRAAPLRLRRRAPALPWGEIAFWLLPIAAYALLPSRLPLLAQMAVLGLFALSLDLLVGYAGLVSLGHAAFYGTGAYAAGLLAQHGWGEPISGLLLGAAAAASIGFATSFLVLRGSDLTRLMVTLGIAMMLYEAANKAAWLTGGADGLQGIEIWPILGLWRFDLYGRTAFLYALGVLFVLFLVARRVTRSPFGLSLQGIRENARRMPAIGTPVNARLVAIYTVSAAYAGVAGALLAQTTQFVSLDVLGFDRSAEVLLVLVLGGAGTLYGALLGAVIFASIHDVLSELTPHYWEFWMGVTFVALVLLARGGVMGLLRRLAGLYGGTHREQPGPAGA
jgi:branched-chain amino acid transport system permease protein